MCYNVNKNKNQPKINIYLFVPASMLVAAVGRKGPAHHLNMTHPFGLWAGAATADITPKGEVFLYGYPHVLRYSTGVHDPLECAALFLRNAEGGALFLASDVICFAKQFASMVRQRICTETGVPEEAIMVSATHTHSGPVMVEYLSNAADSVIPKADLSYLNWLADRMVETAREAVQKAVPAEAGLAVARVLNVGSNRHDPSGATDPEAPVLIARSLATHESLGCMVVYGMHPTVLHEDSTLISADFPHFTRQYLRQHALPGSCPVVYHNGASGNQSPRYMTRANTFAEAQRLGENCGSAIAAAIRTIAFLSELPIRAHRCQVDMEQRKFPSIEAALRTAREVRKRFDRLKRDGAPRQAVRTAECDVFGAEETVELVRAATDGRMALAIQQCVPAEIQLIEIGPWKFVGWPGEFFVEYGLTLKACAPGAFLVTLANGELQGYIVTPEAAAKGVYESTNAIFAPTNGLRFVNATLALIHSGR